MKKPWIAAIGNFFFMGLGTLYNGRRILTGIGLTIGAIVLTYVELQIQSLDSTPILAHVWGGLCREYCTRHRWV